MTIPWQVDDKKCYLPRFCRDSVPGGRQEVLPGTLLREYRGRWEAGKDTWNAFAGKPWQVGGGKGHLEHFRGNSVPGGKREGTPGTLSRGFRARWAAGSDTWNTFAGIPCQVEGREGHLERFRGNSVAGGRRKRTPGTLLRENRGRWAAEKDTWHAFAGKPWQVGSREMLPDTLSREFRGRWAAGRCYLTRFRGKTVAGGRRERLPGTLSREFRGRWSARKATWNAFAGIPWQVDGGKGYLEHFRGKTVAGGRREETPGTLSRENRGRWKAGRCHLTRFCGNSVAGGRQGDATWNAFAGIPCQVGGKKGYLEHFRGNSVAGGRREETPGTLLRENRGRWAAGKATWNDFAGIPWQVDSRKGHLERFCGDTVAGGQRDGTPGTLLRENRARWEAG